VGLREFGKYHTSSKVIHDEPTWAACNAAVFPRRTERVPRKS
jgi:hypothetical protein